MATEKSFKFIGKFKRFLFDSKKRINLLLGGAGSGKSYQMALHFVRLFYELENARFLIVRKTLPSLKITAYRLILDLLNEAGLPYKQNKSEMTLSYKNNEMLFKSLDNPEKIKSYEANKIWIEEATELSRDDYLQLNLRLRRKSPDSLNQMYLTFNPVSLQSYLYKLTENPMDDTAVLRTTYLDNPFLQPDYIKEIEGLKDQDITYWKIYGQGKWASPENIIYKNWDIVDEFPECDKVGYGLDFGFNNPTSLPKVGEKDQEIYIDEALYESKLTNTDLIVRMQDLIKNKNDEIIADCAEPQRIKEIEDVGFNIFPCIKGKGSVKIGIDRVKRYKLHITKRSVNIIKELRGYKWRETKNGIVLDEPVPFRDHAMDAIRYYLGREGNNEPEIRII